MSIPRQVGNYQLESMLGRGGTSEVWLGRHKHLRDRAVAVKILMSHDAEAVERFQREAQLTSKLRHPGIVQIYDHGHYQPFYCTVMEYLPGGSLRQLLDRQSRLPRDQALAIFAQVADALDYAHTQGVIHRDVSANFARA
jgi:eukaryotic-like serine/threonine-protein kinase